MYSKRSRDANHKGKTFPSDDAFKWQFSHSNEVRINFCGLWDTASSYGWVYDPVELPFLGSNPIIDVGRHAISIDERRCFYKENLWGHPGGNQDFRQVWFSGVHSDVGGSYPEHTAGLSKIALEWMMVEAVKCELRLEEFKAKTVLGKCNAYPRVTGLPTYAPPDPHGTWHESLKDLWWLLEYIPQQDPHPHGKRWYLPRGRRRIIPPDSIIHASVFQGKHAPPDLPRYTVEEWVPYWQNYFG
jgi:Uncharacterized alpha/beta hydrolase domain (DUF2235)